MSGLTSNNIAWHATGTKCNTISGHDRLSSVTRCLSCPIYPVGILCHVSYSHDQQCAHVMLYILTKETCEALNPSRITNPPTKGLDWILSL